MTSDLHPLQKESVRLLESLYCDAHLPPTPAMVSILNGYYPSVEAILGTLLHYKNEKLVSDFLERNHELIDNAKNYVAEAKEAKREERSQFNDIFAGVFGSSFSANSANAKCVSPLEALKSVPLKEIEETFSIALSQLCKEELTVSIDQMDKEGLSWHERVAMRLNVTSKNGIR